METLGDLCEDMAVADLTDAALALSTPADGTLNLREPTPCFYAVLKLAGPIEQVVNPNGSFYKLMFSVPPGYW